ncbi:uncharacterized protein LOC129601259 isoform X2 [Paramacrobiotus metropolitanus]|uniref:uncharacterized protein LOC129601259 isoform X2 n=1 Tax=Paramacrobiotus metropolitanus TaxID=2943436 RepID=UPI002445D265|nr:uncharacterized protein LOC129601259 isoform X2 [Paramacrobiotus metropolitanus]
MRDIWQLVFGRNCFVKGDRGTYMMDSKKLYRIRQHTAQNAVWILAVAVQALFTVLEWSDFWLQPGPATTQNRFLCFFINAQSALCATISLLCLTALALHGRQLVRTLAEMRSVVISLEKGHCVERQLRTAWMGLHVLVLGFLTYALVLLLQPLAISPDDANTTNYAFFNVSPQQRQTLRQTIRISAMAIIQGAYSTVTLLLLRFGYTAKSFNQQLREYSANNRHRSNIRRMETLDAAMDQSFDSTDAIVGWPAVTLFLVCFVAIMEGVAHIVEFPNELASDNIARLLAFPLYYGCLVISTVLLAEWSAKQRFETIIIWSRMITQNNEQPVQESRQNGNGQVGLASGGKTEPMGHPMPDTISRNRLLVAPYDSLTCKYYTAAEFFLLNRAALLQVEGGQSASVRTSGV